MTTIKQEVKEQLRLNVKAKARLAYEFAKHSLTIDRWIDTDAPILSTDMAVKCISEELNIPENEILNVA